MKKKFVFLLFVVSLPFYAQVSSDINDYFYKDLTRWETLGLVKNLPHARPYPLQLVKTILNTVIEKGDLVQKEIAQAHYDRFFTKQMFIGGRSEAALDVNSDSKQLALALSFDLNYEVNPLLSVNATLDVWATNNLPKDEILSYTEKSQKDLVHDNTKVGPFWILPSFNSSLAYGTENIYLNLGLMRSSYGPIHENSIVVGSHSLHSAQAHFVFDQDFWSVGASLYGLAATNIDKPNDFYPNKFLITHYLTINPISNVSVSLIESVVYGNRFDPAYLLIFSPYMITQGIYGFNDNSWIGLMASYRPITGLKLDAVFYADDLHFKDIVKFNFDTKWRTVQQINVAWAPQKTSFLNLISLNYTQVMPYSYSHRLGNDADENLKTINYQNYTHAGESIGSSLEPNSDKILIKLGLTPLEKFDIDIFGSYIRHGNPNETIEKKYIKEFICPGDGRDYKTDGSIDNNAWAGSHTAHNYTPFLTQKHLRQNIQTGFDINCRLPVLKTGGYMVFKLGYTLELDFNPGVSKQMYYSDTTATENNWDSIAETQYNTWLNGLGGKDVHNYIRLGFEYFF